MYYTWIKGALQIEKKCHNSQCHNVTIAQLSNCIVTHNVTIALRLDQNASHLYCKQSVFWIVSILGSNNIRNKLTEKVYILERFASHKCSSRSTFEKVLKGEYELSTRALSGWMLMICTVWFGVTLEEHGLQSRLTWWHWRHLGNLVTQAAATRRVTSKHVYDRSLSQWYTHCKGNNANLRQQGFMKQFEEIFNEQA